jgi:hypothetical protein
MKVKGLYYYKTYNAIVDIKEDKTPIYFIMDSIIQLDNIRVNQFIAIRRPKERIYEMIENGRLIKLKEFDTFLFATGKK